MLVNKKEIFKVKTNNKHVNIPNQICLAGIPNGFGAADSREVYLKGNIYDFLVDYNANDKFNILIIHKHSMVKNNIKDTIKAYFLLTLYVVLDYDFQ